MLKGKTIQIGRTPQKSNLMISVPGCTQTACIGPEGSVPQSVSRCNPVNNSVHAEIVVDAQGQMRILNKNEKNATYVNNLKIESKRITQNDTIKLGKHQFPINLPDVINAAKTVVSNGNAQPQIAYNIKHLERVWNDLKTKKRKIRNKQKNINVLRTMASFIMMGFSRYIPTLIPVSDPATGKYISWICFGGCGLFFLYSIYCMIKDNSTDKLEELNEDFQENNICPNPQCNRFLGNYSYELMKRQYGMQCPYCKCKFTE